MIFAIASGKGGTGKTTVSLNLTRVAGEEVQLLDCDVEEPNAHLFARTTPVEESAVKVLMPVVDAARCNACGECSRFCQFNAIACLGGTAVVFPELCHACGGCARICPRKAITDVPQRIGTVSTHQGDGFSLVHGCLNVGVPTAPPVIAAVKSRIEPGCPAILDAPAGTSCPVVETVREGVDYCLLVTEPTPFGLNDLKLAVAMTRALGVPCGVVVNRADSGDDRVRDYCIDEKLEILAEIPDDRRIAEAYSRGELIVDALPEYRGLFEHLWSALKLKTAAAREAIK